MLNESLIKHIAVPVYLNREHSNFKPGIRSLSLNLVTSLNEAINFLKEIQIRLGFADQESLRYGLADVGQIDCL